MTYRFRSKWLGLVILLVILGLAWWLWLFSERSHELSTSVAPPKTAGRSVDVDLLKPLESTESPEAASREPGSYQYPDPTAMDKDQQPLWPIYSFLWAEIYRLRGDTTKARGIYRSLVEWSATKPYKDEWGGSGLAVVSLWRWLRLANHPDVTQQEKEALLDRASNLWKEQPRLCCGMFQTLALLTTLPQLKEDLLRQVSSLAWSLNKKEQAQKFYMEYLTVATTGQPTKQEQELLDEATSQGKLSMPKVALFLGSRLVELGDYQGASFWLNKAMETGKAQVRAEASLSLALLRRLLGEKCLTGKVRELLDTAIEESTDPEVVQDGLFLRAKVAIREGCPKDYGQFQADLKQILQDNPRGGGPTMPCFNWPPII